MENEILNIMKKYQEEVDAIDSKYRINDTSKEIEELEAQIAKEKEFIKKEEFFNYFNYSKDEKQINQTLIDAAKEKLFKMEKKLVVLKENLKKENLNIKKKANFISKLPSGREVTQKEKDELEKFDKRNKAIKELTKKEQEIEEQIIKEEEKLKEIEKKLEKYFKKFQSISNVEKDQFKLSHKQKLQLLKNKYIAIQELCNNLIAQKDECRKCINDLNNEDKEKMIRFSKAWNQAYRDENEVKTVKSQLDSKTEGGKTTKIESNYQPKRISKNIVEKSSAPVFEKAKTAMITINSQIQENGVLQYKIESCNGKVELKEIDPKNLNIEYYKSELKRLKKEYKLSRSELKKVDPYLINSVDKKLEKAIVLAIKVKRTPNFIDINYDMKNMEKLDKHKTSILKKIIKGAKSNKISVKNFKKGFWQRFLDKLKGVNDESLKNDANIKKIDKDLNKSISPKQEFAQELNIYNRNSRPQSRITFSNDTVKSRKRSDEYIR